MSLPPQDEILTLKSPEQMARIELLELLNMLTLCYQFELHTNALLGGKVIGKERGERILSKFQDLTDEVTAILPEAFKNANLTMPEFILGDFVKLIECAKHIENMIRAAELDARDRIAPDHL